MKNKNTKMTNDVNKKKTHFCKKSSIQKNFVSGKNSLLVMWLSSGVETGEIFSEKPKEWACQTDGGAELFSKPTEGRRRR